MDFSVDTCKWVLWGAKYPYDTFGHIHEAFLRALHFLGKEAYWLDNGDDLSGIDFQNTCFLSMNCVVSGMPQRKDCFYVVHYVDEHCRPYLEGLRVLNYGQHVSTNAYAPWVEEIAPQVFFDEPNRTLQFRWGTDLLPHEIEANKPTRVFNSDSRLINYIGTIDPSNWNVIADFRRAAEENGIRFEGYGGIGGGTKPVVSIAENVRLIRESYMAPTLQRLDQVERGYIPCRLFKNISYGQFGITHSKLANELFGGRLIYNPDTYRLFYDAREQLQAMPLKNLHDLMDEVAAKHTYLNKISAITEAVRKL